MSVRRRLCLWTEDFAGLPLYIAPPNQVRYKRKPDTYSRMSGLSTLLLTENITQ